VLFYAAMFEPHTIKHFLLVFRPLANDFLSTIIFIAIYVETGSVTTGSAPDTGSP
jgi:hypothetical protein